MCSWCYGFAPELTKLKEAHPDLPLIIINGGLRPNGTERATEMADFLRHHWQEINQRTGLPFNYDCLEDPDFVINTEPPARACVVARQINPEKEFEFFKELQRTFYEDGKNITLLENILPVAEYFDFDRDAFTEMFNQEELKKATWDDFQLSANMGIRGFPSVVYKRGEEYYLVCKGFMEVDGLQKVVDAIEQDR